MRISAVFLIALLVACGDAPAAPISTDPRCGQQVLLRRGDVREIRGASAVACVVFAASPEASEYVLIAAHAGTAQDVVQQYRIEATPGLPTAQASVATEVAVPITYTRSESGSAPTLSSFPENQDFRVTIESRLRSQERQRLNGRSLSAISLPSHIAASTALAENAPVVGDTLSFRVGNAASTDLCANFQNVRAVVKASGRHALVLQDVQAPAGGFTSEHFRYLAADFDSLIYPVGTQWFGSPSDVNGDQRISILFTPAINRLTPPGSLGFAGGFFFSSDLLARSIPAQQWRCDASNEQEIFYLLAPDVNGEVNGNRFSVPTALESARGTMAHEFQHMINQGVRQSASPARPPEVTWLNEALSHFAEEVTGRAARGFRDSQALGWNDVLTDLDDFDSFFRQNVLRLRLWMERPDLASAVSSLAGSQLAPRGAGWALVRYSVDQYGGANPRALTRALVSGPQVDIDNLERRTGVAFDAILPGFLTATFADTAGGLASRYRLNSWRLRDVMESLNGGVFPLQAKALPATFATQSLSGSGTFFTLARPAAGREVTVRMLSISGGSVAFDNARLYVVRIR